MTLQRIHLRINEHATGQPTPVRLRVTGDVGTYYAPFGRATNFPWAAHDEWGGNLMIGAAGDPLAGRWAYIDGACEMEVPAGRLTIAANKGPEFQPLCETVDLPAGKLSLRFSIERRTNLQAEGWFSGDTRAHFITPHAAWLEAAAEDLAIVHLLAMECARTGVAGESYLSYPNLIAFSGQQPCLDHDGHQVFVGTHNRHATLGDLALLFTHRVVYPLTFGEAPDTQDWTLSDWCNQAHRKGGLAVWTDAFDNQCRHGGEALADLILGRIDAIEWRLNRDEIFVHWYDLLNTGCRVPVVGASAKTDLATSLGETRTYARIGTESPFTPKAWIEAVRSGETFATSGPILNLAVEGQGPGSVVENRQPALPLHVRVQATSVTPNDRIELIKDGEIIAESATTLDMEQFVHQSAWFAARCVGRGQILAHTSPVYVHIPGQTAASHAVAITAVNRQLEKARAVVEESCRFSSEKAKARLSVIFEDARKSLIAL